MSSSFSYGYGVGILPTSNGANGNTNYVDGGGELDDDYLIDDAALDAAESSRAGISNNNMLLSASGIYPGDIEGDGNEEEGEGEGEEEGGEFNEDDEYLTDDSDGELDDEGVSGEDAYGVEEFEDVSGTSAAILGAFDIAEEEPASAERSTTEQTSSSSINITSVSLTEENNTIPASSSPPLHITTTPATAAAAAINVGVSNPNIALEITPRTTCLRSSSTTKNTILTTPSFALISVRDGLLPLAARGASIAIAKSSLSTNVLIPRSTQARTQADEKLEALALATVFGLTRPMSNYPTTKGSGSGRGGGGGGEGGSLWTDEVFSSTSVLPIPRVWHPNTASMITSAVNASETDAISSALARGVKFEAEGPALVVKGAALKQRPPPTPRATAPSLSSSTNSTPSRRLLGESLSVFLSRTAPGGEALYAALPHPSVSPPPPPPPPSIPSTTTAAISDTLIRDWLLMAARDGVIPPSSSSSSPSILLSSNDIVGKNQIITAAASQRLLVGSTFETRTVSQALSSLTAPRIVISGTRLMHATPPGGDNNLIDTTNDATTTTTADDNVTVEKRVAFGRPLDAVVLASSYSPALDSILTYTILQLPRLVAEAAASYVGVRAAEGASANESRLVAAAVGGPLVSALQDTLADVDVVSLIREAVAARVQAAIVDAARSARAKAGVESTTSASEAKPTVRLG